MISGDFPWRPAADWSPQTGPGALPAEWADVGVGADDRVHLLGRDPASVLTVGTDGGFLASWAPEGSSTRPHGIAVSPDGGCAIVDAPAHVVRMFAADGAPRRVLGRTGHPSETGVDTSLPVPAWPGSIRRAAGPFHMPAAVAFDADGSFFVADGYGNARVHSFDAAGRLIDSWGAPGVGAGEFLLPHHVIVRRDGTVLVCDREGDRLQVFDRDGSPLAVFDQVRRPAAAVELSDGRLVVAELPWARGEVSARRGLIERDEPARLTLLDPTGGVLGRCASTDDVDDPGFFLAPHGIASDTAGDLYLVEVRASATGRAQHPAVSKWVRG